MKLLFELSGEHPALPVAELECVGTVLETRMQVAVAECPDYSATQRLALTHVVSEYLGECEASVEALRALLKDLALSTDQPFAARVKKMHGAQVDASQLELERCVGSNITGPVSLTAPQEEYRAVFSEDRCYFGRVLVKIDRGSFAYRNPLRRPFFHPGVMMPIIARALVNLSLARAGDLLLDPFCGTGGVLLEARCIGISTLGMDADPAMIAGSKHNLAYADVAIADATALPIRRDAVDAVVTDLPYGQSVRIRAQSMDGLYDRSLAEVRRVLKPGRRAVVVTHQDITALAGCHFDILQYHEQRVHKSLTRRIMVMH
jgi:tRNA (guanine10-N2)-dimethyltransferase